MNENFFFNLLRSVSFLAYRGISEFHVLVRRCFKSKKRQFTFGLFLGLAIWQKTEAFTQVTVSTTAPPAIEKAFIAATTNQFLATLIANPLAANTYSIKILGPNPSYMPPTPMPTTLEAALSLGATVYVYGFSNGMEYERSNDLSFINDFVINCSSPSAFDLVRSSANTFDFGTCEDALMMVYAEIYKQNFRDPIVIPPVSKP